MGPPCLERQEQGVHPLQFRGCSGRLHLLNAALSGSLPPHSLHLPNAALSPSPLPARTGACV